MNLYLTHKCNRGCPFCFAKKVSQKASHDQTEILTIEDIEKLFSHFKELGTSVNHIGLLGGEPFLYPHLRELLHLFDQKGVAAKIFTSATNQLPEVLEEMDITQAIGKINFIVNVGTSDTYNERQFENLEHFLHHFAPLVSLSFTILDLSKSPDYLFDLIDKYQLNRDIRTGIALPILNGGNQYISLDHYKEAGKYFVSVATQAAERGITLSMDCGFIACMFTTQQIGKLLRLGTGVHFLCGTAMDIGPGLQAWNCFPLFQIGQVDAMQASDLNELERMLKEAVTRQLGTASGILNACAQCSSMQKNLCEGGCLSFKSVK